MKNSILFHSFKKLTNSLLIIATFYSIVELIKEIYQPSMLLIELRNTNA